MVTGWVERPSRFQAREEEARRLQATEHELTWSDAASMLRNLRELGQFRLRTEGKEFGDSRLGWRESTVLG